MSDETWISVDVETSGPTPSTGSLIAIGACLVDRPEEAIELLLAPDPDLPWSEEAAAVHGLDRDVLERDGLTPRAAMHAFDAWVARIAGETRPVFVALNATFDWMFVADAAWRHLGHNPFGVSALDIKALYLGRHLDEVRDWGGTTRIKMLRRYPVGLPHTHRALDDAREQAAICRAIRAGIGQEAAPPEAEPEEALDARLRRSLDVATDAYAIYRPVVVDGVYTDATLVYVNRPWIEMFLGPDSRNPAGRSLYEVVPSLRGRMDLHARVFLSGIPFRGEVEIITSRGRRQADLSMTRVGDELVAFTRDITEQRRTEAALVESREMLRQSMDAIIEGYGIYRATFDAEGRYVDAVVVYANAIWKRQYSPDDPDVEGRSLYTFPGARRRFDMHARLFATREPFRGRVEISTPDGRRVLDLQLVSFGEYFVGSSRDITDQLRAEAAVRESERRYREMIDGIDALIWDEDVRHGRLSVSRGGERLTGYPAEQWQDAAFWHSRIHPDDLSRVVTALTGPDDVDIEYRMFRADGQMRWFRDRMRVVADADGTAVRRYGVTIDVTERRELEERLRRSERFSSVGELAAAVSHDFDNVLFGIGMFAGRLLDGHPDPEDQVHRDADAISRAVVSASGLTKSLLAFAREQPAPVGHVVIDDIVKQMAPMLEHIGGSRISAKVRTRAGSSPVVGDPSAIEQALMNLALNARDAMPDGGSLEIETRAVVLDDEDAEALDAEAGAGVILSVRDTGSGMDEETRSRAFEPYFTTKAVGQGTGLGLATVYGTAKACGGGVAIISAPGHGTTVQMFFPAAVGGHR